jgi:hypothetical protein
VKAPFRARFAAPALTALLATAATLGACGPAPREAPHTLSHAHVHPEDLQGPLTPHVQSIQFAAAAATNAQLTSCEARLTGVQKLLAKALDERGQKVELPVVPESSTQSQFANATARPEIPGVIWHELGGAEFFEDQRNPPPALKPRWSEEVRAWEKSYLLYLEIRDNPQDPRWEDLNIQVRSLILDDRRRLIDGIDYTLSKDDVEGVKRLSEQVTACKNNFECSQPQLDEESRLQIERSPELKKLFNRLESEPDQWKRRGFFLQFALATLGESFRVDFKPNRTILRKDERTLLLPLDPGPFDDKKGSKERLESLLETFWSSPDLRLDIEWRTVEPGQPKSARIYRFDLGQGSGERAFVDHHERFIRIFSGDSINNVYHEVGHVLGLPDRYYTVWNPQTCTYVIQTRPGDLMSDSNFGKIVDSDWTVLNRHYPWVAPAAAPKPKAAVQSKHRRAR